MMVSFSKKQLRFLEERADKVSSNCNNRHENSIVKTETSQFLHAVRAALHGTCVVRGSLPDLIFISSYFYKFYLFRLLLTFLYFGFEVGDGNLSSCQTYVVKINT